MDSRSYRREMSKRRKPAKHRHRHAQYYEEGQESISQILDRKRRRKIPNTPGLRSRDSNEWVLEPSITRDKAENHQGEKNDDETRFSRGDNAVITYRKLSDTARNFHSTDSEIENEFGDKIDLKTSILKISNSKSLRSRKNRSGVCLEGKEQEEIEHIIDEFNPSAKRKKINYVPCDDSQDSVSDYSVSKARPSDVNRDLEGVNDSSSSGSEGIVCTLSSSSPPLEQLTTSTREKGSKGVSVDKQAIIKFYVCIVTTALVSFWLGVFFSS